MNVNYSSYSNYQCVAFVGFFTWKTRSAQGSSVPFHHWENSGVHNTKVTTLGQFRMNQPICFKHVAVTILPKLINVLQTVMGSD